MMKTENKERRISTKDFLKQVDREVKKLEIRCLLTDNSSEKVNILQNLKRKQSLQKALRAMTSGKFEYREMEIKIVK